MTRLVTVAQMRAIEKAADQRGVSYAQMMQTAGLGLAEIVFKYGLAPLPADVRRGGVVGLVGSGNNGGDALVALAELARRGVPVLAYLLRPRPQDDPLLAQVLAAGGECRAVEQDPGFCLCDDWLGRCRVILDGVLGTGVQPPLRPEIAAVFQRIAAYPHSAAIFAVDCPSGADCDTGTVPDETLQADFTVCMGAVKVGLTHSPALERCGRLMLVDLGLPEDLAEWQAIQDGVVLWQDVQAMLPVRPLDAHKGTFGTAMVVAGSLNYTGAAYLAARAAYRSGAGLVRLAVPEPLHAALAGVLPEVTWLLLPHEMGVIAEDAAGVVGRNLERVTALLFGPGLGAEDCTAAFVRRLLQQAAGGVVANGLGFVPEASVRVVASHGLPALVVDADGLRLLARIPDWHRILPAETVLTPHPGEFSLLTGLPVAEVQADRVELARQYARQWGHVVVLKGARTVVATPDGRTALIPVATPALARAGTGDVLAGLIAGLRAQGLPAGPAAQAGAGLHAWAGLAAQTRLGTASSVLASEVLEAVAVVLAAMGR